MLGVYVDVDIGVYVDVDVGGICGRVCCGYMWTWMLGVYEDVNAGYVTSFFSRYRYVFALYNK